jgi:hypothetical protein
LTSKTKPAFQVTKFLTEARDGRTVKAFKSEKIIFAQGDNADAIFYIQKGKVKLTVLSKRGKEAVIAVLGPLRLLWRGMSRRPIGTHVNRNRNDGLLDYAVNPSDGRRDLTKGTRVLRPSPCLHADAFHSS